MNTETRISLIIALIILIFYLFDEFSIDLEFEDINLNPYDYARITAVDYKAEVLKGASNGSVNITERLTFDIHAASKSNLFWELWRDLVESEIDGVNVKYSVNSVEQILDDGTRIPYSEASKLYWYDSDYTSTSRGYGPGKWYHSPGPYSPSLRKYECVFFYVDGLYREQPVFEINYDMKNAILRYNDCSELYLSLYSEDTIKYLKSFNAQILVPNSIMPTAGNYEAHTYGTNSNSFSFSESDTKNEGYHTFYFNLDESKLKFKPYNQYIEFSLVSFGEDKHIFSKLASKNDYYNDDVLDEIVEEQKEYDFLPFKFLEIKLIIFLICLAIAFILINKLLKSDDEIENKYNIYNPTTDYDYFREIPSDLDPLFAANLVFSRNRKKDSKITNDGYAAILLSLVRKKYIELERIDNTKDWTNNNVKIIILYKPETAVENLRFPLLEDKDIEGKPYTPSPELEPLSRTETLYFNLLSRHTINTTEITMANFQNRVRQDTENTDTFVRNIENSTVDIGVSQKYFQKADYAEPRRKLKVKSVLYAIIGILILTVGNFITYQTRLDLTYGGVSLVAITFLFGAFILGQLSKKYLLYTQFGEDEYSKWRGLYNFLNSETLMKERTVIELPLWEKYLVYATAFGISQKVINAIKIRCATDIDKSPVFNQYYYSNNFHYSCSSFRTSTHHAAYTARSGGYSGYGGHGGYGGGGRGGGGGRRWSLNLQNLVKFLYNKNFKKLSC